MSPPASTAHVSSAPTVCVTRGKLPQDEVVTLPALCGDLSYQMPATHRPCVRACPYVRALVLSSTFLQEVGANVPIS